MENNYCYTKIIVLGSGKLAYQCAELSRHYLNNVEVYEYKVTDSTILQKLCEKEGLKYFLCGKKELRNRLLQEEEDTLVVSAGNTYLIPAEVVSRSNLKIVNWHNALLPFHKGRNAEAWSIFQGDAMTGITWHWLTADVDAGDIIAQEKIELDDEITALKLFQKQCDLGIQVFENILEPLLLDQCSGVRQSRISDGQMHFSWEVPNEGMLDIEWDYAQISRFLRSMDYGALQLLGKMYIEWQGQIYSFRKYRIVKKNVEDAIYMQDEDLYICRENHEIVLLSLNR